ncbi:hypothetical protein HZI73_24475 [Vallitalea pronyensis]|uniref:Secreted protein n=1 Tax=Vallitalea pronyensis TaxID=1348613 RepID=A0A8J8MNN5_9FIRM|nr:hypothetical protein [Vallitalea pronyensis]QUI25262.1 hypothetical protein HZI73_24475 [Vallitalea pronyensis]
MRVSKRLITIALALIIIGAGSTVIAAPVTPSGNVYKEFIVAGCTYESNFYVAPDGFMFYGIGGRYDDMDGVVVRINVHYVNNSGQTTFMTIKTVSDTFTQSLNFSDHLNNYSIGPPAGYTISKIEAKTSITKNGSTTTGSSFID